MPTPLAIPSQLSLLASLTLYPLLFRLITPGHPSHIRFVKSREAISALHCTLVALISIYELKRHYLDRAPSTPTSLSNLEDIKSAHSGYGANLPVITIRSSLSNAITAWETGYLLQDTVILLLGARLRSQQSHTRLAKEINWRVLLWHHGGLSVALLILQWYIARGKEKGVLVIIMLMLMNASTPVGTLHWYLVNFRPGKKTAIMVANVAYLVAYAAFRVYLIYWILSAFGEQTRESAFGAYRRLRLSCQIGTATIGVTNSIWLMMSVRKFSRRYLRVTPPKKAV
ncbi:hypothetical protein MMC30_001624 [Trapelia coarctata]|nr:hypothetical protein [Trapelia coarctata]